MRCNEVLCDVVRRDKVLCNALRVYGDAQKNTKGEGECKKEK